MSDQKTNPKGDKGTPSSEYGFDEQRNPLDKDKEQAEASEYGIYGYIDEPGEAPEGEVPEEASPPPAPPKDVPATEGREKGGQNWEETEHGAGFAQPMEEPQRTSSRSSRPDSGKDSSS